MTSVWFNDMGLSCTALTHTNIYIFHNFVFKISGRIYLFNTQIHQLIGIWCCHILFSFSTSSFTCDWAFFWQQDFSTDVHIYNTPSL